MRLPGASAPKTLAGRIIGADKNAQAAAAELLRSCRRVILSVCLILCRLSFSCLPFLKRRRFSFKDHNYVKWS
jgi:hypothetical protein